MNSAPTPNLSDPKYVGPGIWFSIHNLSYNAHDDEGRKMAIKYIYDIQQNFPCQECKQHFGEYLRNNPPPVDGRGPMLDGRDLSLFYWSWLFHNAVNARLGKVRPTFDQVYQAYRNKTYNCHEKCGAITSPVAESLPIAIREPVIPQPRYRVPNSSGYRLGMKPNYVDLNQMLR